MRLTKVLEILAGKQLSQRTMRRVEDAPSSGISYRGGRLVKRVIGSYELRDLSLGRTKHYSSDGKLFAEHV